MQMTYFQFDSFLVAFLDTVTKVSHTIWTRWGAQSTRTWQTFWWPRWKRRVVTMWRFQGLQSFLKKVDQRKRINQVKVLVFFLKPLIRRSSWRLGVEKKFQLPVQIKYNGQHISKHRQRGEESLCFTKKQAASAVGCSARAVSRKHSSGCTEKGSGQSAHCPVLNMNMYRLKNVHSKR